MVDLPDFQEPEPRRGGGGCLSLVVFLAFVALLPIGFARLLHWLVPILGLGSWFPYVALLVIGIGGYWVGNAVIIHQHEKHMPGIPVEVAMKATRGTGVVPKWASLIGLLWLPCIIAAVVWFFR